MSAPNFINLFSVLLKVTKGGNYPWEREKINRLLFSSRDPNNNKILIEQYFAEEQDKDTYTPCITLSIFNKENLIDEIVLCESSPEKEEYNVLKELYSTVDEIVTQKENEKNTPIIDTITESIEKMATH